MQKKPWAKKEIRQQNIKKLRQALQNCGKAESESVEEFEQQILDKSRSMEEYLQNVAKVLVHCSNSNKMQNRHMAGQVPHNSNIMPGMHGAVPGGPGHHPPSQAPQPGMMQMHPGQMTQGDPGGPGMMGPGMAPGPGGVQMGMIQRRQMFSNPNVHPGSPHVQSTGGPVPDEDQLYAMKLAELQKKYIVPLQKLKEKNAQKKSGEMKRIDEVLDVLMSSRKIKMDNLVSIESVLFKLFTNKSSSSGDSGSVERPPMSADKAAHLAAGGSVDKAAQLAGNVRNTHFCQPLIDGVANHACNSSFFHTVRRTFGLGLYSLHGDVTQYPPAKRPKKGEPCTLEILDSEIERLPTVFKAQVKNRSRGDLEVEVKHMKHSIVPSLCVVVPKKYPEQSPWVKGTRNKLGLAIEKDLENNLIAMSMNCTLTEILLYWEVCIKKCLKNRISRVKGT